MGSLNKEFTNVSPCSQCDSEESKSISLITSYQTAKYKPQNQQHASLLVMMANPDLQFKVKI